MSAIVEYYTRDGEDHKGRTWLQTLMLSDRKLEYTHDYIQWLFPLDEPSKYCKKSPVLTQEDINALRSNPVVATRLCSAVDRMLRFYGGNRHWRDPDDHNLMRITRMLKCLVLLGQPDLANEFYDWLTSLDDDQEMFAKALRFWQEAVGRHT